MDQKLIQVIAAIAQQQGIDLKEIGEEEFRSFALQVLNLFSLGNGGGEITNDADLQNVIADATAAVEQDPQKFAQTVYEGNSVAQEEQVAYAKWGAKLNYINYLRGNCPQGYEMRYFKKGGKLCKVCVEKAKKQKKNKNVKPEDTIDDFKKKYEVGGDTDDDTEPGKIYKYRDIDNPEYIPGGQEDESNYSQMKSYTIKKGDWLSKIARDNNTTVQQILEDNPYLAKRNKYGDDVRVGDNIYIRTNLVGRGGNDVVHSIKNKGENRERVAEIYGVPVSQVYDANGSEHDNKKTQEYSQGSTGFGYRVDTTGSSKLGPDPDESYSERDYEIRKQRNGKILLVPYASGNKRSIVVDPQSSQYKALWKILNEKYDNGQRISLQDYGAITDKNKRNFQYKIIKKKNNGPAKGILGLGWFNGLL